MNDIVLALTSAIGPALRAAPPADDSEEGVPAAMAREGLGLAAVCTAILAVLFLPSSA